jgi:hypothetical protein
MSRATSVLVATSDSALQRRMKSQHACDALLSLAVGSSTEKVTGSSHTAKGSRKTKQTKQTSHCRVAQGTPGSGDTQVVQSFRCNKLCIHADYVSHCYLLSTVWTR